MSATNPVPATRDDWMRAFLALAADTPLPKPPDYVRERLRESFARYRLDPVQWEIDTLASDNRGLDGSSPTMAFASANRLS